MILAMARASIRAVIRPMAEASLLTAVLLRHRKNKINDRLLFCVPRFSVRLDWQRALAVFSPGQVFGYVRWRANTYGTQTWQLYILRALGSGPLTAIPGVHPGADILLKASGASPVKKAFKAIEQSRNIGLKPVDIPPAYWRHSHLMLREGLDPHPLSKLQCRAACQQEVSS